MNATFIRFMQEALLYIFASFMLAATLAAVLVVWVALVYAARTALLRTLEVAAILEAGHEAKRQGRAPILRAWIRQERRWGNDR